MNVGIKIKEYLDDNGISQSHISKKTNIRASKLNLALNGKRRLTFEEYSSICYVLGVDTNYFLKPKMPEKAEDMVAEGR